MCALRAPTVKVESVSEVTCKQKQYWGEEEKRGVGAFISGGSLSIFFFFF